MKIIFDSFFKKYADRLASKITGIEAFASKITDRESDKVDQAINNGLTVVFDTEHEPYIEDTTDRLEKLIAGSNDRWIKNCFGEKNVCGECYCPIMRNDEGKYTDIIPAIGEAFVGGPVPAVYNHSKKTITMYTRNIGCDFEDYISCFAHTYFYAVHYYLLDLNKSNEALTEYYHNVIICSLATFFKINYLKNNGFTDKAAEIEQDFNRSKYSNNVLFNPHAGYIYLDRSFNRQNNVFAEVLRASYTDFVVALKTMIYDHYMAEAILTLKKKRPEIIFDAENNGASGKNPSGTNSKGANNQSLEDLIKLLMNQINVLSCEINDLRIEIHQRDMINCQKQAVEAKHAEIKSGFEDYLMSVGLTTTHYADVVCTICKKENIDLETLLTVIDSLLPQYDRGGIKESEGSKGNFSYINALRHFSNYARIFSV